MSRTNQKNNQLAKMFKSWEPALPTQFMTKRFSPTFKETVWKYTPGYKEIGYHHGIKNELYREIDNWLLEPLKMHEVIAKNRVIVAPMTRNRCDNDERVPNALMVEYYKQRATAGLIVTEPTAPHPSGVGTARTPGLWNKAQRDGWKKVVTEVHVREGKIFLNLSHCGRLAHLDNKPEGNTQIFTPSVAELKDTKIWSDKQNKFVLPSPATAMTFNDIRLIQEAYVDSARYAQDAGFDGIEIDCAHGTLIHQFLHSRVNKRHDQYGGNLQMFLTNIIDEIRNRVPGLPIGIRVNPCETKFDLPPLGLDELRYDFAPIAYKLKDKVVYIHLHHSRTMPTQVIEDFVEKYDGVVIGNGYGTDFTHAEKDIRDGIVHGVSFGTAFLSNPDLADRIAAHKPVQPLLPLELWFSAGRKGYVDI